MERDTNGTVKRMAKIAEYKDGTVDGWHSAEDGKDGAGAKEDEGLR